MNAKSLALAVTILTGMALSLAHLYGEFETSKAYYDKANICTAKLVAQGVPRSDISRSMGVCTIISK